MLSGHKFRRQPLLAPHPGWDRIEVSDLLEDAGRKLWVATTTGIYVIGNDGGVQHITKEDGLPNEWVNALLLDKYGRLWAGTRDGLVLMRDGNQGGRCGVQQVYREIEGVKRVSVAALAEGEARAGVRRAGSGGVLRPPPPRPPPRLSRGPPPPRVSKTPQPPPPPRG